MKECISDLVVLVHPGSFPSNHDPLELASYPDKEVTLWLNMMRPTDPASSLWIEWLHEISEQGLKAVEWTSEYSGFVWQTIQH